MLLWECTVDYFPPQRHQHKQQYQSLLLHMCRWPQIPPQPREVQRRLLSRLVVLSSVESNQLLFLKTFLFHPQQLWPKFSRWLYYTIVFIDLCCTLFHAIASKCLDRYENKHNAELQRTAPCTKYEWILDNFRPKHSFQQSKCQVFHW